MHNMWFPHNGRKPVHNWPMAAAMDGPKNQIALEAC